MIYTYPPTPTLVDRARVIPSIMHPFAMPTAVIVHPAMTPNDCDEIHEYMLSVEGYEFPKCGSTRTSEVIGYKITPVLRRMEAIVRQVNRTIFGFDLNEEIWVWHQLYEEGSKYELHKDTSYGQSRKLSAILQLTDPGEYIGGELDLIPFPDTYTVPKGKGVIVVFPSYVLHQVSTILRGERATINMGFFGPPFR